MRSSVNPRRNAAVLFAILLVGAGCNEPGNRYVVEMRPIEQGLERRVFVCRDETDDSSCTQIPGKVEGIVADRLERAYGVRPDSLEPFTAQGRFADIPEDVGNRGAYRAERTLLGFSAVYVERFRGNAHAAEIVGRPLGAADSLYDLVRTWCRTELEREPGWPALNSWLETEVHAPLRDFASAGFLAKYSSSRHEQFPIEMIPLEHPELLALISAGIDFEGEIIPFFSPESALDSARAHFAHALGLRTPAESERVLAFLADGERAKTSLVSVLGAARNLSRHEVLELWTAAVAGTWFGSFDDDDASSDSLEVRFETGSEPYDTNGGWDAATGRVIWHARIPTPENGALSPPFHCRAFWAVPDSARQLRLFGRILLEGADLAGYCTLFTNLDAKHRREWDRAVAALRPGKLSALERFRFADERARGMAAGDSTSRAYPLARLILRADGGGW